MPKADDLLGLLNYMQATGLCAPALGILILVFVYAATRSGGGKK